MKPFIKVSIYGNFRLKDVYPGATKWEQFKYRFGMFLNRGLKIMLVSIFAVSLLHIGSYAMPKVKAVEVIKEVEAKRAIPPILVKIAKCESVTGHYDTNGQVVLRPNLRSVDIGKYQINDDHWGKKATEMGLNLMNEQDNETFALWLYENRGTVDWYLSSNCWNK